MNKRIKYKQAITSLVTKETQKISSICFYKGLIFFLKQIGSHFSHTPSTTTEAQND